MTNLLVLLTLCTGLVLGQVNTAEEGVENAFERLRASVGQADTEPKWGAALVQRAKTFARIGDWENGIEYLESYILMYPEDAEARLLLAECYFNWSGEDNRKRAEAQIHILEKLGETGFEMLLKGLHSDTHNVFYFCSEVFRKSKDRRAIDDLIRVVEEKPDEYAAELAVIALADIEKDRDEVDGRVARLLIAMLENAETRTDLKLAAARGLVSVPVREAVPTIKKELERAVKALSTLQHPDQRQEREHILEEAVYLVDAVVRTSPKGFDKHVRGALDDMTSEDMRDFLGQTYSERKRLSIETLGFLSSTVLDIVKTRPRTGMESLVRFVDNLAEEGFRGALLRPDVKEQLHELCEHPQRDVRLAVIGIVGKIRDEDALPILLPRLRASWLPPGTVRALPPHGSLRSPRVPVRVPTFGWGSDEPAYTWEAVKRVGSPRTADFLLEKLESEDIAWVYTAAALLMDIGEGRAIEPLKKRYSELAGGEGNQVRTVLKAIEGAYLELSGRPIPESDV